MLGLPPESKYPRGTGPRDASLQRLARVLVERARDPFRDQRRLLEQTVVNVALLNTDAHAKNISFLHTGDGTVSLSPMYDVVSAAWFLPAHARAAMPIGGKWRISEIERHHLLSEATSWGMPEAVARDTIAATLDAVRAGLRAADDRYPDAPDGLRRAVTAQVERLAESR